MKSAHMLLLLGLLFLISCTPQVAPPSALKDDCSQQGQVLEGEMEETSRGYSYRFEIYLPPCYDDQTETSYPIFYFIPGSGGYPAVWFSAGINTITDRLILDKTLPPFIIVTTDNTDNDFKGTIIHNELVPYIETHYRVLNDRHYRAVAGGSLGGITSYRLGLQYPETFSSVGMFGSGAISGEEEQIKAWLGALRSNQRIRFFMDTGEGDPLMLERAKVMDSLLNKFSIPHILHVGNGGHNYNYWASNLEMYFLWITQDWQ